ncbi:MAG: hypothetical protein Kow0074_25950 [Candidatus Zixiibacteriota bacterium]
MSGFGRAVDRTTKRFGELIAVDDLSLSVPYGPIKGIIRMDPTSRRFADGETC